MMPGKRPRQSERAFERYGGYLFTFASCLGSWTDGALGPSCHRWKEDICRNLKVARTVCFPLYSHNSSVCSTAVNAACLSTFICETEGSFAHNISLLRNLPFLPLLLFAVCLGPISFPFPSLVVECPLSAASLNISRLGHQERHSIRLWSSTMRQWEAFAAVSANASIRGRDSLQFFTEGSNQDCRSI